MMRFLNAKARITLGLAGIIVSLTLMAFFLNIIPDKHAADVARRTVLAETVTVYSTALVRTANVQRLKDDFNLLVTRNADLQSLALRHSSGHLLVATGDHDDHWEKMTGKFSTDSQVQVPIWSGKNQWGQLELRFQPLIDKGTWGLFSNPMVQLVLFMGGLCFAIFYLYLGRVLRQLDPSQAIPGRVRSALDTMAEGLLILDRKEQIVLANQAFSSMIDMPAEKLLGYRAGELPWTDSEGKKIKASQRPWAVALAEGTVKKDRTIRLLFPDNSHRTFKTNCSPVLGDKGKYAGVLISFDDITELEQKEIELLSSKLEAEEANKAKSSFLANMSHEIRTPMNAILGFTEILKRGYIKNEQESLKYLNTIHSSGKNLLELINDILDLSKVESGQLEVEKVKVNPYLILHGVVQMLQVKAQEKGIGLEFNVASALPAEIETDPVRLRQIVLNLIGNSIKFTETGHVAVSCRLINVAQAPLLVIDIQDTGIGMETAALQKIFDPFTQADSSVAGRFGGTGLGLAISLRFAKALGGNIEVVSEPGQGSTFSVSLATGDLTGVAFQSAEEINLFHQEVIVQDGGSWKFPPARVLVVDDGSENRELIRLLLAEAGLVVDEAENGQIGVDMALKDSYDVILMDINMPVMDGYAATGALRRSGLKAPIVALTANAMKGDEETCLAAGYSHYLSKPINIDQFMELMATLLQGMRVENESDSPEADAVPVVDGKVTAAVESAPIYSSLPVHKEKFRVIVERFVLRLETLLNDMDIAVDSGDYGGLANLVHTLKGSAGTVGFDVFTEPAKQLESYIQEQDRPEIVKSIAQLHGLAARVVVGISAPAGSVSEGGNIAQESMPMASPIPISGSAAPNTPIVSRLANNKKMARIIISFIETLAEKLALMDKALREEDFNELALLAHWLKGSGGTVGFDVFTAPAESLEKCAKDRQGAQALHIFNDLKQISQALALPPQSVHQELK